MSKIWQFIIIMWIIIHLGFGGNIKGSIVYMIMLQYLKLPKKLFAAMAVACKSVAGKLTH